MTIIELLYDALKSNAVPVSGVFVYAVLNNSQANIEEEDY
jgi:hypothetical protein